jgi:hypothetical protein
MVIVRNSRFAFSVSGIQLEYHLGGIMAPICQCGCGESLPEGSTRQYKRGHKDRIDNPVPEDGFTEVDPGEALLTLEDMANQVPDDPEPADVPEYKPKVTIKVTAAVRRDVEGMLAFSFGMSGQMWSMIDPICGGKMLDMGPVLAKKYTPIVCQSPSAVKFLTKSGKWALYMDAAVATWPLVQVVIAHHLARSVSVGANGQGSPAPNEYVVT